MMHYTVTTCHIHRVQSLADKRFVLFYIGEGWNGIEQLAHLERCIHTGTMAK